MPYTLWFADWKDAAAATGGGDTSTPLDQAALDHIEGGIDDAHTLIDDHIADTTSAHDVTAINGAASLALIIALG